MLLPIAAILLAEVTTMALRVDVALGVVIIAGLITTDFMHRIPLGYIDPAATSVADRFPSIGPVRFPFLGFLYEVTHHFDAPECVLACYLNMHARKTDVVITTYDDLPLNSTQACRVTGGLEGRKLPEAADWLIKRRWILSGEPGKDSDVDAHITKLLEKSAYTIVNLHKFDHMLGTNPDPMHHFFATPETGARLILLRRTLNHHACCPLRSPAQMCLCEPGPAVQYEAPGDRMNYARPDARQGGDDERWSIRGPRLTSRSSSPCWISGRPA